MSAMQEKKLVRPGSTGISAPSLLAKLRRDQRGTTAIEMGMVALPFFFFIISTIGYGIFFFTQNMLEYGVETASRQIRTGQAQTAATPMTVTQFKQLVCDSASGLIHCDKLKVFIDSANDWSGISPRSCLSAGTLALDGTENNASGGSVASKSGGRDTPVVVTLCYEWELAQTFRFMQLSTMGNGSALIQAVSAFRSEPF